MPRRVLRGELVLLAVGLLVALALAEGFARLWSPGEAAGGYAPVRTDGRHRGPLNSRGYRDLERAIPKPDGVRRALCLGDSFTWGAGVLFEDTWPQRLERTLTRERENPWEAVVVAEPGFGAVQLAERLEPEGFPHEPDVVILAWVLNDAEDVDSAEARRGEDWVGEQTRQSAPTLFDRSALVGLVRGRLRATRHHQERIDNFRSYYEDDYPGWVAARQALKTMGGMCRSRGVPFVVGIFPLFGNPLDDTYPFVREHERVAQVAADAGALVVDLLPQYHGLRWDLLVVDGPRDEHPNEIAHRIAAQALVKAVDEVVPRDPGAGGP